MGSRAVEDLCLSPDVENVTIADRDARAAGKVAQGLPATAASATVTALDATDHAALVAPPSKGMTWWRPRWGLSISSRAG